MMTCKDCGWLEVNPSGAMFCGYSDERTWENESCAAWKDKDVRPVVMCKDCKHRDPEDQKCDYGQLARAGCIFPVDDDYYCAYGEKS